MTSLVPVNQAADCSRFAVWKRPTGVTVSQQFSGYV